MTQSGATLGTAILKLSTDNASLEAGLGKAEQKTKRSLSGMGKSATKAGKSMSLALTAPIIGFAIAAIKAGADFERSMNRVQAVSGATAKEFKALENTAKDLGRTTQFSAGQAADAMGFLAMAGFEANEIIGAMPSTLQLAAAGQMDLARAADIATNILTGFGLEVTDLSHANDVLVKTFTSSNVSLTELGESMKMVAPVAKAVGLSFEETAAAMGLLGNAGIKGTQAGTVLRRALANLIAPTDAVADKMRELGITVLDTSGDLIPLEAILQQLTDSGASAADMLTIFGVRAGPGMIALVSQGADALRELTRELENSGGTAQRIAETQMEGLHGSILLLKSALEGMFIAFAQSGILDFLTQMALKGAALFSQLSETNPEILRMIAVVGGILAVGGPVLLILGTLATTFVALSAPVALIALGIMGFVAAMALLELKFGIISKSIGFIDSDFLSFIDILKSLATGLLTVVAVLGAMKIAGFVSAMRAASASALTFNMSLGLLGIAVAIIDGALRAFTGGGIIENVVKLFKGTDHAAVGAADAVKELDLAFLGLTEATDRVNAAWEVWNSNLAKNAPRMAELQDLTNDSTMRGVFAAKELEEIQTELAGAWIASALAAIENGESVDDVIATLEDLNPVLRDIITSEEDYAAIEREQLNLQKLRTEESAKAQESLDETIWRVKLVALEEGNLADVIKDELNPATQTFFEKTLDLIDALDEEGNSLFELSDLYGILTDQLIAFNPEVVSLNAETAILNERQAELEAIIRDLTEAENAELEAIKARRDEIDGRLADLDAEAEGFEALNKSMSLLTGTGEGSYIALQLAMDDAGVSGDDMFTAMSNLQQSIENVDPVAAISALEAIKDTMSEEEWNAVAGKIIPGIMDVFTADLTDPVQIALMEANFLGLVEGAPGVIADWLSLPDTQEVVGAGILRMMEGAAGGVDVSVQGESIGSDFVSGVSVGIESHAAKAVASVSAFIAGMLAAARSAGGIESPSKEMRDQVGIPLAEGIIVGLESKSIDVGNAVVSLLNFTIEYARTQRVVEKFGDLGSDVVLALQNAMSEGTARAGDALAKDMVTLIAKMKEVGVPGAKALGDELLDALTLALQEGTADAVRAALDLVDAIVSEIALVEDAAEAAQLAIDEFTDASGSSLKEMAKEIGSTVSEVSAVIISLVDIGVIAILGELDAAKGAVGLVLDQIIADVIAGVLSVEEALAGLDGVGIDFEGNIITPTGVGGTQQASGATMAQQASAILGFDPFSRDPSGFSGLLSSSTGRVLSDADIIKLIIGGNLESSLASGAIVPSGAATNNVTVNLGGVTVDTGGMSAEEFGNMVGQSVNTALQNNGVT